MGIQSRERKHQSLVTQDKQTTYCVEAANIRNMCSHFEAMPAAVTPVGYAVKILARVTISVAVLRSIIIRGTATPVGMSHRHKSRIDYGKGRKYGSFHLLIINYTLGLAQYL